jgi:putative membrane protein
MPLELSAPLLYPTAESRIQNLVSCKATLLSANRTIPLWPQPSGIVRLWYGMFSANLPLAAPIKIERTDQTMKPTIKIILAISLAVTAQTVFADDANSPGQSSPQAPITEQEFTWDAGVANLKEIRLAEFAGQNSTNDDVKMFARHMIHDHSAANRKLTKIAAAENLDLPDTNVFYQTVSMDDQPEKQATQLIQRDTPENIQKEQQISAQRVEGYTGQSFDQAYADAMVKDHVDAIQLFENASQNLTNQDLKTFATKILPTLHRHYDMAQKLQAEVGEIQTTNLPNANPQTNTAPVLPNVGM